MQIYFGIVENRNDPLELGRCQVRVVGLHTHDKNLLPTSDLPWCAVMQPTTSAAMNGIGYSYVGPVEGTSVVVTYLDDNTQQGLIMGSVGGVATEPVPIDFDDSGPILDSSPTSTIALRSVKTITTGNKLKFYDPNANRTDLTSKLTANMRVSGYGIQDGTTIVSIDSGTEITISTSVREFGENIVEFDPPLANAQRVVESRTIPSAAAAGSVTAASPVQNTAVNTSIPTIPPTDFKGAQISKISEGIKALIAACDKVGLTTKEQKCALLGIVGGECEWIQVEENHQYKTKERLKQVFSFLNDAELEKLYNAKGRGISPAEFFSVVYGTTKRGKNFLGNKSDADGGIYYGRGFIQFTGRENYEKVQKDLKKYGIDMDVVNNPNLLFTDINAGAIAAAAYLKRRVAADVNPNAHPAYFYAAKEAVGVNVPNIAERKKKYYEYFYGADASNTPQKDAGVKPPTPPADDASGTIVPSQPGPSLESIKSGSFGIGFRDPNNKYPLKEYIGESDINRLARGVIEGTIVKDKDSKRKTGIPIAMQGEWSQPEAPYNSKYPFNKVIETESGHVQEWDDTPGYERTNTYHRSGTFTEVDSNGTQVNYIVGDNFILMENNGCIHVAGQCNITVDGNTNLYARSDANIQVAGNTNLECGGNLDVGVASDATFRVAGNFDIKAGGQFRVTADAGMEVVTGGSLAIQSDQATSMKVGDLFISSDAGMAVKTTKSIAMHSGANIGLKAGKKLFATAAGGSLNIKASGPVKLDGSTFLQQTGAAGSAANVEGVSAIDPLAYSAPALGDPLYKSPPFLIPPERQFEESHHIETPEDWDTPEGRSVLQDKIKTLGVDNPGTISPSESNTSISGGKNTIVEVDTSLINTTKDFPGDYRLSPNFSLGMCIAGGVNGQHKLQSQMLNYAGEAEKLFTVQEIVGNLARSAQNVLEPLLAVLPGGIGGYGKLWHITSGYRLKGAIGGKESSTSDHNKGHCFDIQINPVAGKSLQETQYDFIQKFETMISYDQLILEYEGSSKCWIHVGYRGKGNRKMAFTMVNHSTYPQKGAKGFHLINSAPTYAKK